MWITAHWIMTSPQCFPSWEAPLKQITIPRLELTSAMLAVTIKRLLKEISTLRMMPSNFRHLLQIVLKPLVNRSLCSNIFMQRLVYKRCPKMIKLLQTFICLACCAVHLEVPYSPDTDSCINAFRCIICR